MSPRTSLPRSSPGLGGSPWEEPTQPQALLGRRESTPRRGLSGVSRAGAGLGMNLGTASLRRALTEEEGRAMGHSPSGGRRLGLARTTQEAARCRDDAGASLKVALGRG